MTKEEIDILWNKALRESIDDGSLYTRYRFAELVAEAEREMCAKVCDAEAEEMIEGEWTGCAMYLANNIRARGETK